MLPRSQGLRDLIDQTIRAQLPSDQNARKHFLEFIHFIRAGSQLIAPANCKRNGDHDRLTMRIRALLRISLNRYYWIRPIESWVCEGKSINDQFHSLLRYLFAKYPVPRFLDKVWYGNSWFDSRTGVHSFLRIAQGAGPRQCGLPVRMTKSEARHFMGSPDDLNLHEALRWAQVRAAGGSITLARTILQTRLAQPQCDEAFWKQTVEWFCRAEQHDPSTLSPKEIIEIVDFIQLHRFEPAQRVLGYAVNGRPLQPEFTLRGRAIRWMRRHMVNWRTQMQLPENASTQNHKSSCWQPLGISGLRVENDEGIWSIVELLTGDELAVEGGIMQHCVASYDRYCVRGQASIWSVRLTRGDVNKRMFTIEINPYRRTIVQVKGKKNRDPTVEAANFVQRWVRQENLYWPNAAQFTSGC